ncbi:MAG: tetratricopeptide repeat protein [Planctomycetota bacterium]
MKPTTPLFCAATITSILAVACAGPTPSQGDANQSSSTSEQSANGASGPFGEQLMAARALLTTNPDQAADAAEALLKRDPDLRRARTLLAESSLAMARSPDFQSTQFHLIDAHRQFEKALHDADDKEFARELRLWAEANYELGEWERGSQAAARSADGFSQQTGQAMAKEYATSRLVGGRCDFRRFAEARQAEMDGGEADQNGIVPASGSVMALATRAAAGLQEARLDYPAEATNRLAEIHLWLGRSSDALLEYERGLLAAPDATGIHDAYIAWMVQNGQQDALIGSYRRFVREKPDAPILRWFQGRAIFTRADRLRREGNYQGAIAIYDKSRKAFGEYLAVMPQHRPATLQWQALCDLGSARCAADSGDWNNASERLLRAGDTSPTATEYTDGAPALSDSYGNHFAGCAAVIGNGLTQAADEPLARALAFNEEVLRRHPDKWGFLYNNAALTARDLGVQRENEGKHDQAMELWERSYQHYEKAVELSPEDARIINDCGLMLVYHLGRNLDRARELLDRAIELGTAQLEEMPEDAPKRDRELLEEAVGDAWHNIAVLKREHEKAAFADYRKFCEEAVKYYPYQRREAAALLRNEGREAPSSTARAGLTNRLNGGGQAAAGGGSSSGGAAAGGAPDDAAQGGGKAALDKARAEIDKAAEAGDYDTALTLLDKLSKDCKDFAPYHVLRGKMNWLLGNQARDNNRKGTEFFYKDAAAALKRAFELDPEPVEPRQMLAQALYDSGDVAAAAQTVSALLLHIQSQGGGSDEQMQAAHALRANAASRGFAAAKSTGETDAELLTASRTSMRWLEQKGSLDRALLDLWSTTELWAEAPAEAVNVYVRASERAPQDFGLLDKIVSVAADKNQLPIAIEAFGKREDAGTIWYLGKAQFYLATEQRQNGKAADALKTLGQARTSFVASMQKNAGYRDSCEQWIAMCVGKQGNIEISQENWDDAEKLLLEAARLRPDRLQEDLGLAETTKRGILSLVDHYYRGGNLGKVESISRAAAAAADSDVDLLNNAGLFARDYGVQLSRRGKDEQAREMYEQSYKAYRRAQELDPKNVRLRNDCALIAIYHLERDWDLSKELLDAAIADGERMLKDEPPSNGDLRQQLEEAVGDCCENLALWHLKHSKDAASAKAAATKSMDYYPGKRRPGARRHLQAAEQLLQGK